ncbi:hypothetical protein LCGC14_1563600 [marine sediment metagenome]|uniref:Uncharacterized protein n=1 Tax=marine sediment metagenome TaxID=412755 RepID=A0A0F9ILT3_9ZZZZ
MYSKNLESFSIIFLFCIFLLPLTKGYILVVSTQQFMRKKTTTTANNREIGKNLPSI